MSQINKIITNALAIFLGRGFNLFLSLLIITLAARYLGVKDFGIFSSITALLYILSKIIDGGYSLIVFRETSQDQNNLIYINAALSLRLILFLIVMVLLNVYLIVTKTAEREIIV